MNPSITENQLLCSPLINHLPYSFLNCKMLPCSLLFSINCFLIMSLSCYKIHWGYAWNSTPGSAFHLDNKCLMIFHPILNCCIDLGKDLTYIPNFSCLLWIIYLRLVTIPLHHSNTKGYPCCKDIHNRFNTATVLFHCLYFVYPQFETRVLSPVHWISYTEPRFSSHQHPKVFLAS